MSIAPFLQETAGFLSVSPLKKSIVYDEQCILIAKTSYFSRDDTFLRETIFFHTAHIMTLSVRTVNTAHHDKTSIPCI